MVGSNNNSMFKTRICLLYQKGQCNRGPSCNYAHGDADLRRYNNNNNSSSSSFNGRPGYHGADLRERLGRHRSPPRRNSLERDPVPSHGYGSPRLGKKSDWDHRKRQHFDGDSDYSGSLRLSDGTERHSRERKRSSSELQNVHDDQFKQLKSEVHMLEDHKQQLQINLEESVQEADSLNSKIEELEMQLSAEKEECRRISSKLRKFVKANNRHTRIQDELKRSQARLQKLGEQLGSDARAAAANEEDIGINMLSDEENLGNLLMSPQDDNASPRKDKMLDNRLMDTRNDQYKASPSKKRMRVDMVESGEKPKQEEWRSSGNMRSEIQSRRDPHLAQTKNTDKVRAGDNGISNTRPLGNDHKPVRRKSNFNSASSGDKYKDIKSTRMVASMVDEVTEVVELNEKTEAKEISSNRVEKGSTHDNTELPLSLPPPPPLPVEQNAYLQYIGKDEIVDALNEVEDEDADDVDEDEDEDEMLDVDIV